MYGGVTFVRRGTFILYGSHSARPKHIRVFNSRPVNRNARKSNGRDIRKLLERARYFVKFKTGAYFCHTDARMVVRELVIYLLVSLC